jgi:FkbM family methyltransferase
MINSFKKKHPWLTKYLKKYYWSGISNLKNYKFIYCVDGFDFSLELDSGDDSVGKPIYLEEYEKDITSFVKEILKGGEIVFDVGANIGFYTILFSKLVGAAGKVHAFEPSIREFLALCRNLSINNSKNVYCNQLAVGNKDGVEQLTVLDDKRFGAYNSLAPINHHFVKSENAHCETARVITLDRYCELFPDQIPVLIKIDVEGAEKKVFMGADLLLKSSTAPIIIFEVYEETQIGDGGSANTLTELVRDSGYSLYSFGKGGKLTPFIIGKTLNAIAIKKSHVQRFPVLGACFEAEFSQFP